MIIVADSSPLIALSIVGKLVLENNITPDYSAL